jgi:hypothetical protein
MTARVAPIVVVAAVLALVAAAPAHAALVEHDGSALIITDPAGQADDLHVGVLDDGSTFAVTGPTAQAGDGCQQGAGVVLCPAPYATALDLSLGAGDDRLVVETVGRVLEETPETFINGGDGADTLEGHGFVVGGPGNDVLRINQPSNQGDELDGQDGDDELFAGARPAILLGGPGADVLHGGPADDWLVDVLDRGSHDTIGCGGGHNHIDRDAGDRLVGCKGRGGFVLALVKHHWNVWRGGLTEPTQLELTPLPGREKIDTLTQNARSWTAKCRGRGCHGARFKVKKVGGSRPTIRFSLRGGVQVPGRDVRAMLPGATVTITFSFGVSIYNFVKELRFTTRATRIPRVSKACFASETIYPQLIPGEEGVFETSETKRKRILCG